MECRCLSASATSSSTMYTPFMSYLRVRAEGKNRERLTPTHRQGQQLGMQPGSRAHDNCLLMHSCTVPAAPVQENTSDPRLAGRAPPAACLQTLCCGTQQHPLCCRIRPLPCPVGARSTHMNDEEYTP